MAHAEAIYGSMETVALLFRPHFGRTSTTWILKNLRFREKHPISITLLLSLLRTASSMFTLWLWLWLTFLFLFLFLFRIERSSLRLGILNG